MEDTAVNPLREGLLIERQPDPNSFVIFGASGDLTRRKLVPALYNLELEGLLPGHFAVVGVARRSWTDGEFRAEMRAAVDQHSRSGPVEPAVWEKFETRLFYSPGDFDDPATFTRLADCLVGLDAERGTAGNRLFYLATAPEYFGPIAEQLGEVGLARGNGGWVRLVVEKPFGHDRASARALNDALRAVFRERQIFRIDHYLGKETVQNLLVFRFANGIFEPVWNRNYVDHVQITVAEAVGVEGRGGYYDEAGVLRDMLQNHILQLLTLVAMEAPSAFEAQAVRDEKVKVLRALRAMPPDVVAQDVVRAQYAAGAVGGEPMPAYRAEPDVRPESVTDTFLALRVWLDNWRWAGVPFYLRSGKALPRRSTEVAIQFRHVPLSLFPAPAGIETEPNLLALNIQPNEGIALRFVAKRPGSTLAVQPVHMDFRYGTAFGVPAPEAYERLLLDAMLGEAALFTRDDEVEAAWVFVDQIAAAWAEQPPAALPTYEAGTWGPAEAQALIERDGRRWRRL